jgi:ABC-type multidrug transport system ATPase subunit
MIMSLTQGDPALIQNIFAIGTNIDNWPSEVQSKGQQLRQILGVQLQSSSLPDGIQPKEAMALICAWHGRFPRFDLLSRFGIDPQTKKAYREMSTGQKRRLHLALALANDPAVVILDEPTTLHRNRYWSVSHLFDRGGV